jgi:hypothetical protein
MTLWETRLFRAERQTRRKLRRPRFGRRHLIGAARTEELRALFSTAPLVQETLEAWVESAPLSEKDEVALFAGEKAWHQGVLLASHPQRAALGTVRFWLRVLLTTAIFIGLAAFLVNWLWAAAAGVVRVPWYAGVFFLWVLGGIGWNQIRNLTWIRPRKKDVAGWHSMVETGANQGIAPAEMIRGQLATGLVPTLRQWKKAKQWIDGERAAMMAMEVGSTAVLKPARGPVSPWKKGVRTGAPRRPGKRR